MTMIFETARTAVQIALWAVLSVAAVPAAADTIRSCTGTLSIYSSGNDLSYDFTIPVTVSSRVYANRPRERSREAIISCVQEHWGMRMTDSRPNWCNEGGNYPFQSFSKDMTDAICAANPGQRSIVVGVRLRVHGGTGCFRERYVSDWGIFDIADDYRIYCSIPRDQVFQNTDMPGGDYTNFTPETTNHQECQKACDQQDRCQAWTYVRPRDGRSARCWLKDRVPERRPSNCCVSGTSGQTLN